MTPATMSRFGELRARADHASMLALRACNRMQDLFDANLSAQVNLDWFRRRDRQMHLASRAQRLFRVSAKLREQAKDVMRGVAS